MKTGKSLAVVFVMSKRNEKIKKATLKTDF